MQERAADYYVPAEDTFLLEDHIRTLGGTCALDIGSGTGHLARVLARSFAVVVGTDISFGALRCQEDYVDPICCSWADALSGTFDLIICNPPYLPSCKILDATTDGGIRGVPIPLAMMRSAVPLLKEGGLLLFVTSSLADYERLIMEAERMQVRARIAAKRKLFFEEILLIELRRPGRAVRPRCVR